MNDEATPVAARGNSAARRKAYAETEAVIASFRAPFSFGETALSTAPGRKRKKPTPPANPPSGG